MELTPTHRHVKTGGLYRVLHNNARLERDLGDVVIYKSLHDGSVWVRPYDEFHDGRFAEVPPVPPTLRDLVAQLEATGRVHPCYSQVHTYLQTLVDHLSAIARLEELRPEELRRSGVIYLDHPLSAAEHASLARSVLGD